MLASSSCFIDTYHTTIRAITSVIFSLPVLLLQLPQRQYVWITSKIFIGACEWLWSTRCWTLREGNKTSPNLVCELQLCSQCQSQSRTSLKLHSGSNSETEGRSDWFWHIMGDHHVQAEKKKTHLSANVTSSTYDFNQPLMNVWAGKDLFSLLAISNTPTWVHVCTNTHVLPIDKPRHEG